MRLIIKIIVLFILCPAIVLYAADEQIKGQVTLEKGLKNKVSPSDTVFIFVRAEKGPRAPLAVYKVKVKDLPHDFQLDDSHSQIPIFKLSGFIGKKVKVIVRISKSGDAMAESGDLEGESKPIKPGAQNVKVRINRLLP